MWDFTLFSSVVKCIGRSTMSNKFASATAAIITTRNNVWLGLVALRRLFEFGFN